MEERRRSKRITIQTEEKVVLPLSLSVQVLDISVAGVLLQSSRSLEPGSKGSLRVNMGGTLFAADIAVQHVSPVTSGHNGGYRIGARFVAINAEHQRVIERFTNQ